MRTIKVRVSEKDLEYYRLEDYHLNDLICRLGHARRKYCMDVRRRRWFNTKDGILPGQDILFAKLQKAMGLSTRQTLKLESLKTQYLGEINQIWKDYYHRLAFGLIDDLEYDKIFINKVRQNQRVDEALKIFDLFSAGKLAYFRVKGRKSPSDLIAIDICSLNVNELSDYLEKYVLPDYDSSESSMFYDMIAVNSILRFFS